MVRAKCGQKTPPKKNDSNTVPGNSFVISNRPSVCGTCINRLHNRYHLQWLFGLADYRHEMLVCGALDRRPVGCPILGLGLPRPPYKTKTLLRMTSSCTQRIRGVRKHRCQERAISLSILTNGIDQTNDSINEARPRGTNRGIKKELSICQSLLCVRTW